ncbi:MAG: hypothetical protein UY98_C0010G0001, partial [Candidatus Kaiserbacteria bacterium GW2011_GWA2_58_9]
MAGASVLALIALALIVSGALALAGRV